MGKNKIQKQLEVFLERVKKYNPQRVILCGSYAKNRANEYSDVDIVIVSDAFKGVNEKKRFDDLYKLTNDLYPDFQVHGVTTKEIDSMSKLTTLYDAITNGVVIS
ncbi:MAG: nucleotidyltransferase domain-containing protein [Patescibacteria group bacterium]